MILFKIKKSSSFFLFFILFFSVMSCSSHPYLSPQDGDENSKDLVDTFKLNNDQISKFKVESLNTQNEKNNELTHPSSQKNSLNGLPVEVSDDVIKKKYSVKKKEQKAKNKNEIVTEANIKNSELRSAEKNVNLNSIVGLESVQKKIYPKDFPEDFKEFDQKYRDLWQKNHPLVSVGEEFVFKAKFWGATAGYMTLTTSENMMVGGKEVYHFKGFLQSAEYYKYIYTLNDRIETFIEKDSFLPIKYSLVQRESSQDVDDLQVFDRDAFKTYHWYKRVKKGVIKNDEKSEYTPYYIQDSLSAFLFIRGLPLKTGDYYEFPVVTRAKVWILKIWVEEEEEISMDDKEIKTMRLRAETHYPGVLESRGNFLFWISSDSDRKPLKFSAKVKLGSITGELVGYKKGR